MRMKSRVSGQSLEGAPTGRKTAAKARSPKDLRASEVRFRRLFETAQDGVLILDATTHRILEANPFIAELLGVSRSELIGKRLAEIGILTSKRACEVALAELKEHGLVRFEHSIPDSKPGQARDLEFVCNVYRENGKQLIQCNIRDIVQRKEGERRLREALSELAAAKQELENRVQERTADLQQRNAELEAFSYSLSHDLRAPIRAIVSFTQIALDEFGQKLGDPGTELLGRTISAAQRLDRLIMDVLAFSRTTRQHVQRENIDVDKLLQEILHERPEWNPPRAKVSIDGPLLPIRGDRASLTQCLTNLLDNAVKFVPEGVTPTVLVYTQPLGARVRLVFQDNGIGIPLSDQARVFELFQRAHNGYEGHGIGLAIVRRAAERMGGSVGLESEPSKGSKFWVDLPKAE